MLSPVVFRQDFPKKSLFSDIHEVSFMNYHILLDMVTEIGYRLAMCGAETYRIEESVNRITAAYGVIADAFAIPNCLHITIRTDSGETLTRMRRIGYHGNDLDSVEKFSNLSRRICHEHPDPAVAMQWIKDTKAQRRSYSLLFNLLGHFLGAAGFSVLFGAVGLDCILAGIGGIIIGLINRFMEKQKANQFFQIITAAFAMSLIAYLLGSFGLTNQTDAVVIGALMILVPGLLFTNAMRDIIYGDTNSGINRIVQVLLIAVALAVGTAAAWNLVSAISSIPVVSETISHPLWYELLFCFIGCTGFFIVFNIHGVGGFLCALGGLLTWFVFRITVALGGNDYAAYFFATIASGIYAEIMARIRKYPAISYLVISIFPLIPGAGVYYTMMFALQGDTSAFADKGIQTAAIAGVMAAGILLSSTIFRMIHQRLQKNNPSK